MPTVQFRNVVKRYGDQIVIENLDLDIADGEFVVLLGPSGCGKTTLLNVLAGLLDVDHGAISIDGRDVTDLDPKDRGLAMVFQSYALYPTKTVRGNLVFGLSGRRLSTEEIASRVAWATKLLQIDHLLDRKPGQLSGGQRQRVAIGRALVKQVGVCLFDEPLSNLDAKLRTEMRMEIKKLHGQLRNTVVYVTHDQVEAMTMATRIAVMDKGVIQQAAAPDEIYDRPENLFVASFIGTPSMNVLDCEVSSANGSVVAADPVNKIAFDLDGYPWRQTVEVGRKVKVGFRPEHFLAAGDTGSSGRHVAIERPIEYFEKSGPDAVAFLSLQGQAIAARVDARILDRYQRGATLPLALSLDRINVFDAGTGRRL
jgi:multiple sugar transport system ATP-binding protein